jgi:DnaJ family protein C protein 3
LADLDPTSFNLHYLRATTYLSQGRHQLALTDFTKLLQLKPDFHQAHLQRARILAKEGDFEQAQKELGVWLKTDKGKGDEEAKELVSWQTFCLGLSCRL